MKLVPKTPTRQVVSRRAIPILGHVDRLVVATIQKATLIRLKMEGMPKMLEMFPAMATVRLVAVVL